MSRRVLPAGVAALVLMAIAYAACSGASPPPPAPSPTPVPSPTAITAGAAAGPAQVEAGAPIVEPTSGPPEHEAKVVYIGPRDVPAVALTFDVGVEAAHVPEILDTLKERGKRVTFGITGEWAVTNPDLLKRMVEEGHAVINHSWSHASYTGEATGSEPLTADQIRDELERTEAKVQEIAGVSTKPYFRPPYGDFDSNVNRVAYDAGYEFNVLWLVDSLGWEGRSTESIVAVTLANAFNGSIFLYHTDNDRDFAALEGIIEGLDERGLQMVTIPQLLEKEPIPSPTPRPSPTPSPEPPPPAPAAKPAPVTKPALPPAPTPTPIPTPPPPSPTATPDPYVTLASDDFESGDGGGGGGWATSWWSAQPFVVATGAAHSGSRYLDMAATGAAVRSANLGSQGELHLRFWARFDSLEPEDGAAVRLSTDGITWMEYSLINQALNDNTWRPYDIPLVVSPGSQQLFVVFRALMDPQDDVWQIDDVELAALAP